MHLVIFPNLKCWLHSISWNLQPLIDILQSASFASTIFSAVAPMCSFVAQEWCTEWLGRTFGGACRYAKLSPCRATYCWQKWGRDPVRGQVKKKTATMSYVLCPASFRGPKVLGSPMSVACLCLKRTVRDDFYLMIGWPLELGILLIHVEQAGKEMKRHSAWHAIL